MQVYSLAKLKKTNKQEYFPHCHIFEGNVTPNSSSPCTAQSSSLCGGVKSTEYDKQEWKITCKDHKEALLACINSKEFICAQCEEVLFKKFQYMSRK